jgi:hypothetical protein
MSDYVDLLWERVEDCLKLAALYRQQARNYDEKADMLDKEYREALIYGVLEGHTDQDRSEWKGTPVDVAMTSEALRYLLGRYYPEDVVFMAVDSPIRIVSAYRYSQESGVTIILEASIPDHESFRFALPASIVMHMYDTHNYYRKIEAGMEGRHE